MMEWRKYRKTGVAEMTPYTFDMGTRYDLLATGISISAVDWGLGSPSKGDMIARDPDNHDDKWLVSWQFWMDNYEEVATDD